MILVQLNELVQIQRALGTELREYLIDILLDLPLALNAMLELVPIEDYTQRFIHSTAIFSERAFLLPGARVHKNASSWLL